MPLYLLKDLPRKEFQSGPRKLEKGTTYDVQTEVRHDSTIYVLTPVGGGMPVSVTEEEFRGLNSPRDNPKLVPVSRDKEEVTENINTDLSNNRPSVNPQQSAYSQDPAGYDHYAPYGANSNQDTQYIDQARFASIPWKIKVGDIEAVSFFSMSKLSSIGDGRNISFWINGRDLVSSWPMEESDHGTEANEIFGETLSYEEAISMAKSIGLVRGSLVIYPDNSWGLYVDGGERFSLDTLLNIIMACENNFGVSHDQLVDINQQDPSDLLSRELSASKKIIAPEELYDKLKVHEQNISGGRSDDKDATDFDPDQVIEGALVELEHTDNIDSAIEIAMDHLDEDPNYYKKLRKMHSLKITKTAGLRAYLDDERKTPPGWERVYLVEDLISLIESGKVDEISLDNDLGEGNTEGFKVVKYLEERVWTEDDFVPPKINVHSANPVARDEMLAGIKSIERALMARKASDQRPNIKLAVGTYFNFWEKNGILYIVPKGKHHMEGAVDLGLIVGDEIPRTQFGRVSISSYDVMYKKGYVRGIAGKDSMYLACMSNQLSQDMVKRVVMACASQVGESIEQFVSKRKSVVVDVDDDMMAMHLPDLFEEERGDGNTSSEIWRDNIYRRMGVPLTASKSKQPKVVFFALFLDDQSRLNLIEWAKKNFGHLHENVVAKHSTIQFLGGKVVELPENLGQEYNITITGAADENDMQAITVSHDCPLPSSQTPHITISLGDGRKPKDTNTILSNVKPPSEPPPTLTARLGAFMSNGQKVFDPISLEAKLSLHKRAMYVDVKDLPDPVKSALKSIGYNKSNIDVIIKDEVPVKTHAYADYSRAITMLVNMSTGATETLSGNFGGANPFEKTYVDDSDAMIPLPINAAVIKSSSKGFAQLYVGPETMSQLLPDNSNELSYREKQILSVYSQYKSSARKDRLRAGGVTRDEMDALVDKGLLKKNARGHYQITTDGKNAVGDFRHDYFWKGATSKKPMVKNAISYNELSERYGDAVEYSEDPDTGRGEAFIDGDFGTAKFTTLFGVTHSFNDEPAIHILSNEGEYRAWHVNGVPDRFPQPAIIYNDLGGNVEREEWWTMGERTSISEDDFTPEESDDEDTFFDPDIYGLDMDDGDI